MESVKRAFSSYNCHQFIPIPILSFSMEHYFFGFEPYFTHLFDLILHLLNVFLVFKLILSLTYDTRTAFITALFFGIHPMQVESVAWIRERQNLLYTFFFLASVQTYISFVKFRKKSTYLICFFLMVFSLLCKALAVTLPVIFILCDFQLKKRFKFSDFLEKLPFFALSIIFGIIAVNGVRFSQPKVSPPMDLIFFGVYSIVSYLGKLLFPLNLSCIYPYPEKTANACSMFVNLSPILLAIALLFGSIMAFRYRTLFFGSFFFLVNIIPVSRFFPAGASFIISDHFVYIPMIGFFLPIIEMGKFLFKKSSKAIRILLISSLIFIIVFFAFQTRSRIKVWESSVSLFEDALLKAPKSRIPYNQLGLHYLILEDWDKAVYYYSLLVSNFPRDWQAWVIRCKAFIRKTDFPKALADLEKAFNLSGRTYELLFYRGTIHLLLHDYSRSISDLNEAIALNPKFSGALLNRAWAYFFLYDLERAIKDSSQALEANSGAKNALLVRGFFQIFRGNLFKALTDFMEAKSLLGPLFPRTLKKEWSNFVSFGEMNLLNLVWFFLIKIVKVI